MSEVLVARRGGSGLDVTSITRYDSIPVIRASSGGRMEPVAKYKIVICGEKRVVYFPQHSIAILSTNSGGEIHRLENQNTEIYINEILINPQNKTIGTESGKFQYLTCCY